MAVITISAEKKADKPTLGTRCSKRMYLAKRGRYRSAGPKGKIYGHGSAAKAGQCPNFADVIVRGRPYCKHHAPAHYEREQDNG